MIEQSTVLVLGAGASMPYGYPSGAQLRQLLIDEVLFGRAVEMGLIRGEDVRNFCEVFRYSGMSSIDAFLARRGHHKTQSGSVTFDVVGKLGIALALRKRATLGGLFHKWMEQEGDHTDTADNWYEYLWGRLTDGVSKRNIREFGENRLQVITFNYDTSLEQYLFTALRNSYGLGEIDAMEQLSRIPIHHVYGRLTLGAHALCPHQIAYGVGGMDLIADDADGIQVIDEERDQSVPVLDACEKLLRDAQKIVFLGFGFDKVNVRRLRVAEVLKARYATQLASANGSAPNVFCTTLGMTHWQRKQVRDSLFSGLTDLSPRYPGIALHYHEAALNDLGKYADCKSLKLLQSTGALG